MKYTVITSKETCTGLNWVIDAKNRFPKLTGIL